MAKILWVGDAVVHSGFARVTHGVLDQLCKAHQVAVLGVGYHGGEPHDKPYIIWKTSPADVHGKDRLLDLVLAYQPDVLVLFNDLWIVKEYLQVLAALPPEMTPKILSYSPVDAGGLIPAWVSSLSRVDAVCTYTAYGKEEILRAGYPGEVEVIPHGVDLREFSKLDKAEAKAAVGFAPTSWVVLNANKNQLRKRIDLTIKGFADFAYKLMSEGLLEPERIPILHLHMDAWSPTGMELTNLTEREFASKGLKSTDWMSYTQKEAMPLSTEQLNLLYNSTDVGINTTMGEGWGLCPFEQAAVGVPQILTDCAAAHELFMRRAWMLPIEDYFTIPVICTEGAVTTRKHVADALLDAYQNPEKGMAYAAKAYAMINRKEYRWESVASKFEAVIGGLVQPPVKIKRRKSR